MQVIDGDRSASSAKTNPLNEPKMGHGADGGPDLQQQSLQRMLETRTGNPEAGRPMDETAAAFEHAERANRQRVAAAMAEAIAAAEVAVCHVTSRQLAQSAYESLLFDFPTASTASLHALALCCRESGRDWRSFPFPVSTAFVSGLCHLASSGAASEAPHAPLQVERDSSAADAQMEANNRIGSIHTVLGYVLVNLPAVAFSEARKDGGAVLRAMFASYHSTTAGAEVEECRDAAKEDQSAGGGYILAAEQDQDGDVWEALEDTPPAHAPNDSQSATSSLLESGSATWPALLSKVADLAERAKPECLSSPEAWEKLGLVSSLVSILENVLWVGRAATVAEEGAAESRVAECAEAEVCLGVILRSYVDLLSARLAACPAGVGPTGEGSVGKVLPNLLQAVGVVPGGSPSVAPEAKAVQTSGQRLALLLLASLCERVGAGMEAGGRHELWREVGASLTWMGIRLAELSVGGGLGADGVAETEKVVSVLLFYVQEAPGNARLGQLLLESGVWRAALSRLGQGGACPEVEGLQTFVVLASAASPPLAQFAAALPSVRTLLDTCHPVTDVGPTAHHRLVWQLVMGRHLAAPPGGHVSDAEEAMACLLESVGSMGRSRPLDVEAMASQAPFLQRALGLLLEAARVTPGTPPTLWKRDGRLGQSLSACQVAVRDAANRQMAPQEGSVGGCGGAGSSSLLQEGEGEGKEESVSDKTGGSATSADEGSREELGEEEEGGMEAKFGRKRVGGGGRGEVAEVAKQKVAEVLPRLAQQLKPLVEMSRGGVGSAKKD